MLLADSNVWLALALSKHAFHSAAVLFYRSTQQSFLRLLTTSAVFAPYGMLPLGNKAAWSIYERFLADERIAWGNERRGWSPTGRSWPAPRSLHRNSGSMPISLHLP